MTKCWQNLISLSAGLVDDEEKACHLIERFAFVLAAFRVAFDSSFDYLLLWSNRIKHNVTGSGYNV